LVPKFSADGNTHENHHQKEEYGLNTLNHDSLNFEQIKSLPLGIPRKQITKAKLNPNSIFAP
jgi:hypothetical protein